jgi:hypothetical protein
MSSNPSRSNVSSPSSQSNIENSGNSLSLVDNISGSGVKCPITFFFLLCFLRIIKKHIPQRPRITRLAAMKGTGFFSTSSTKTAQPVSFSGKAREGAAEGNAEGSAEGSEDGCVVGNEEVGVIDGSGVVGTAVGASETEGADVGCPVGCPLGSLLGIDEGWVGHSVITGAIDGWLVGAPDGSAVGAPDGAPVGLELVPGM